jgi:hypothetical protein
MQINAPSMLSYAARPVRANPDAFAGAVAPPQEPSTPAQGGPLQQPVSVATVLENWGTSNPLADLNTDGIVDAQDLALAQSSQNAGAQGVLNNWGGGGSCDHNGDGCVNGADLAFALNAQSPAGEPVDPWQQAAGGDHNGDGTINAQDLAMSLNGDGKFGNDPQELVGKLVEAAFTIGDADADGVLSRDDLGASKQVFRRLDLDTDGSIGREEMTKALMADLDRFRSDFPGAAPAAFARRWLDAFMGNRGAPDLAIAAKAGRYGADPASLLGGPRANGLSLPARGNILSAQA